MLDAEAVYCRDCGARPGEPCHGVWLWRYVMPHRLRQIDAERLLIDWLTS